MSSINVRAVTVNAEAEEVTTLPPASAAQLNKIIKQRSGGGGISKVYICMQNSDDSYAWIQMAISE